MLFPEKMLKVKITIPKTHICEEIGQIGQSALLHVNKSHKNIFFSNLQNRTHTLLQSVQNYMDTLKISKRVSSISNLDEFESHLYESEEFVKQTGLQMENLSNEKKRLESIAVELELAQNISLKLQEIDIKKLLEIKMFKLCIVIIPQEFLEFFELSTSSFALFKAYTEFSKGSTCMALFFDESFEERLEKVLEKIEAKKVALEYFSEAFKQNYEQEKEVFQKQQKQLKVDYEDTLLEQEAKLKAIYKILSVQSVLQSEGDLYILQGWIPQKKKKEFLSFLQCSQVEFFDVSSVAPVLLKTPKLFAPFEELIENFSYPNYTEVNPTVLFAFTFLSMFGMMFGDVGHGAVLVAIGYILGKKTVQYKTLANIMVSTGISAVFFGFLYGSIFGFHHLLPHLLFVPMENISTILTYGLIVGVCIITLSMILNIFSRFKEKNFFHLFFGSGGILWLLVYWFLIGIGVKDLVYNLSATVEIYILIAVLCLLFLIFLYKSKNIVKTIMQTAMEVLEYATNTISFIRLGAFTLSHAALFLALFSIADVISNDTQSGIGYWITMVIGNIVIIVLEGVVVAIQTLRLEYYEFFKRFYTGGGEKYEPFFIDLKKLQEVNDEKALHI